PTHPGRRKCERLSQTVGELGAGMNGAILDQAFMSSIEGQLIDKAIEHCLVFGIQGSMNAMRSKHRIWQARLGLQSLDKVLSGRVTSPTSPCTRGAQRDDDAVSNSIEHPRVPRRSLTGEWPTSAQAQSRPLQDRPESIRRGAASLRC